jgi:signal transduction histidine kinase
MARDVTERVRAENALREREALLRNVLETLPVGVWVTDDKSKIVSGNPVGHGIWAGAKYVGIEQYGEYKGWWAATGKRIEAGEWASARAVTKGETSLNEEIEIECFDGTRKTILNSAVPIRDSHQRITGAIVVNQDITERKRAEQNLRNYTARLQTVSRKLLEVQEDERRRLVRELHDQVGQVLTALKINLQVIERLPAAAPVALKIEECAQIADAALQQVRTLMLDLRPPQLDELGLAIALRAHAERVVAPANLVLHFSAPDALPEMPPAIAIVYFRIMQETLTNILRHAGARNVWIELAVAGDGLVLTVRDDGKGFDLTGARQRAMGGGSIGLLSMEERAALADGRIEISTAPGAGTTVRATFSLQAAQATEDTA